MGVSRNSRSRDNQDHAAIAVTDTVVIVGAGFAGAATAWALGPRGTGPGSSSNRKAPGASTRPAQRRAGAIGRARRGCRHARPALVDAHSRPRERGDSALPSGRRIDARGFARRGRPSRRSTARCGTTALTPRCCPPAGARAVSVPCRRGIRDRPLVPSRGRRGHPRPAGPVSDQRTRGRLHAPHRLPGGRAAPGRRAVRGVHTEAGDVRAERVVDASGCLGRQAGPPRAPLPLQPMRRHVFVSASTSLVPVEAPLVWVEDAAFYFRPESGGLLLSPCDETVASRARRQPTRPLLNSSRRRSRVTRRPGIWSSPAHGPACGRSPPTGGRSSARIPTCRAVSRVGLGGFGMMCSAAIGELAAELLTGIRRTGSIQLP